MTTSDEEPGTDIGYEYKDALRAIVALRVFNQCTCHH